VKPLDETIPESFRLTVLAIIRSIFHARSPRIDALKKAPDLCGSFFWLAIDSGLQKSYETNHIVAMSLGSIHPIINAIELFDRH
jgi:hypothetical protein